MKHIHPYIAIEVENRKLTPFLELPSAQKVRSMPLTTMVDNQKRAIVKLLLVLPEKQILLKEFDLKHLKPGPAGPTRFVLDCRWDGKTVLTVALKVDGSLYSEEKLRLGTYMKKKRSFIIPLILLLAAIIAAVLFLVLPGSFRTGDERAVATTAKRSPAPTGKAAPKASAPEPAPAPQAAPARQADPPSQQTPPARQADPPSQQAPARQADPPSQQAPPARQAAPSQQTPARQAAESPPAPPETTVEARVAEPVPVHRKLVLYFDPNDTELTPEARRSLENLSREISEWESISFTFEGHCALFGTEEGRIELSRDRAQKSAAYVSQLTGIDESQFSISWFAGERPVSRAQEEQELNRRVEISVRGEAAAP